MQKMTANSLDDYRILWKMRSSKVRKVKLLAVLLIFCVVVLLLHSHLTGLLSGKSEVKPRGESWISEIKGVTLNNYVVTSGQRLESVKQACSINTRKSWDSLSATEKQILAKHILVNDEHKFLFCYVPKVACANWKRVIMVLDRKAADSNAIRKVNHTIFTFLADLPPLAAERKLQEYYKFMFVREPLVRLLSAYKDKFYLNHSQSFHKSYGKKIVKRLRRNADPNSKGDDVTLKEFLQYVTESRVEDMNEHWMPFFELCQPCAVSYDFIGSFENLESDAPQVLKELNVNELVSFPKQQKYYQAGGNGYAESKKFADVSPDVLRPILRKYALDYEMFSYQMPDV
ncbi:hypothetical protein ACROYT_G017826 [Oculina patagonica]